MCHLPISVLARYCKAEWNEDLIHQSGGGCVTAVYYKKIAFPFEISAYVADLMFSVYIYQLKHFCDKCENMPK